MSNHASRHAYRTYAIYSAKPGEGRLGRRKPVVLDQDATPVGQPGTITNPIRPRRCTPKILQR